MYLCRFRASILFHRLHFSISSIHVAAHVSRHDGIRNPSSRFTHQRSNERRQCTFQKFVRFSGLIVFVFRAVVVLTAASVKVKVTQNLTEWWID